MLMSLNRLPLNVKFVELPEDEIVWLGGKASKEKSTQDKGKSHLDSLKALLG